MAHDQTTRERAFALRLAGKSLRQIADELTVAKSTVQRWIETDDMDARADRLRREARRELDEQHRGFLKTASLQLQDVRLKLNAHVVALLEGEVEPESGEDEEDGDDGGRNGRRRGGRRRGALGFSSGEGLVNALLQTIGLEDRLIGPRKTDPDQQRGGALPTKPVEPATATSININQIFGNVYPQAQIQTKPVDADAARAKFGVNAYASDRLKDATPGEAIEVRDGE